MKSDLKLLHNLGQAIEMATVEFMTMSKVGSDEGGPMARSGPVLTKAHVEALPMGNGDFRDRDLSAVVGKSLR